MVLDLLLSVVETSYTSLPLTGRARSGPGRDSRDIIPGWTTEVEPHRLESNFCYRVLLGAGTPRQGVEHEARLRSHAQYQHAVRRLKRSANLHQAQGLFNAAMAGDIKLVKEMRRAKSGKGQMDELAKTVDGVSGEQGVADTFANIFNNLYNSSGSKQGMTELQDRICEASQDGCKPGLLV